MRNELEKTPKKNLFMFKGDLAPRKSAIFSNVRVVIDRDQSNRRFSAMLTESLENEHTENVQPEFSMMKKSPFVAELRKSMDLIPVKPKYQADLMVLNQNYILLDEMGHGKFCKVYKCKDLKSQSIRAIKVYNDTRKILK